MPTTTARQALMVCFAMLQIADQSNTDHHKDLAVTFSRLRTIFCTPCV